MSFSQFRSASFDSLRPQRGAAMGMLSSMPTHSVVPMGIFQGLMGSGPTNNPAAGAGPRDASYESMLALDERNVSRGINRQFQRQLLPDVVYRPRSTPRSGKPSPDAEEQCHVCLEAFAAGTRLAELPCKHRFHRQCIEPWLERERTCPVCRLEVYKSAVP